jgi:hypothetical protein
VPSRADGDNAALLRLFFRRIRDDDAALGFLIFLYPLYYDPIV